MDQGWYHSRMENGMYDQDHEDDEGPIPRSPPSHHRPSQPHHLRTNLPQVRVSWQGLLASTNLSVDSFTTTTLHQYHTSGMHQAADLLFFLTHMHADHTTGLTPSWNLGTIYTSHTSKILLHSKFQLPDELVIALPLHRPQLLPLNRSGTEKCWVTLIDASTHCPGAVMFLFEGYFGRIFYTGDIRFDRRCEANLKWFASEYQQLKSEAERKGETKQTQKRTHQQLNSSTNDEEGATTRKPQSSLAWLLSDEQKHKSNDLDEDDHPSQNDPIDPMEVDQRIEAYPSTSDEPISSGSGIFGLIDALYLDNTFCHPRYSHFHSTTTVLPAIQSVIDAHPGCDILLGGDSLGKEDLLVLLSHMMESKIVVPESRYKLLQTMAQSGVKLNTEVDDKQIQRITKQLADTTVSSPVNNATTDSITTAAVSTFSTFESPLNSRTWISCFSPRPYDGYIKLGPKKQVTASNIEWMNRIVRIQAKRNHRSLSKGNRRKRRKTVGEQPPVLLNEKFTSDSPPLDSNSDANMVAEKKDEIVGEYDSDDSGNHSTSDDSDEDEEDDFVPGLDDPTHPVDVLDRPVVGIIVSGWAADRIGHDQPKNKNGSSVAAAVDAPSPLAAINVTASCVGPGPGNCKIHCLPYSSHSSFLELRRFVSLLQPNTIRPLCKGDCNPAVLDDLLNHRAIIKPIIIPSTMTRAALKPIGHILNSEANKQRIEQQTKALTKSILQSSTNFSSLANSIHSITNKTNRLITTGTASRVAMPIGTQDSDDTPPSAIDTAKVHGQTVVLDSSQQVDLTADSLPCSIPSLEDANGVKHIEVDVDMDTTSIIAPPAPASFDDECMVVSPPNQPPPMTSLPRVRSWLELFAMFEHYPHVPIEGLVVPPPSKEHLESYSYAREARDAERMKKVKRNLPKFLQPQLPPPVPESELVARVRHAVETIQRKQEVPATKQEVSKTEVSSDVTPSSPSDSAQVIAATLVEATIITPPSTDLFRFNQDGSCTPVVSRSDEKVVAKQEPISSPTPKPIKTVSPKTPQVVTPTPTILAALSPPSSSNSSLASTSTSAPSQTRVPKKRKQPLATISTSPTSLPSYMENPSLISGIRTKPSGATTTKPIPSHLVCDLTESPPKRVQPLKGMVKQSQKSKSKSTATNDRPHIIDLLSSQSQEK